MPFKEIFAKGKVKFNKGFAYIVKGGNKKNISTLKEALAEEAKCGDCGCSDCPCSHYVLGSLDGDPDTRLFIWNDAGALASGLEADFIAACEAAKAATK